jgi:hypothetical protein
MLSIAIFVFIPSITMLNVEICYYAECHFAECHYVACHAESCYAVYPILHSEYRHAEHCCAEMTLC